MARAIIYTTPTCVYCKMTKEWFKKNNIEYIERNVVEDEHAREEMIEKSHQMGVPVVDVEGEIFVGFNRPELEKKFNISNNNE
jgi:glutaredoxin 3